MPIHSSLFFRFFSHIVQVLRRVPCAIQYYYVSVSHFSRSVLSNSLQPHESQHARPPCPSKTPGVYLSSCPSSRWCHPAISSSVIPFSSCPQSLPASGSFPASQLFAWSGQSIGSFSFSISPSNELPGLISLGWIVYVSPNLPIYPFFFPLVTISLFPTSVALFLFCK